MRKTSASTLFGIGAALVLACGSGQRDDPKPASDDLWTSDEVTCARFVGMLTACDVLTGTRLRGCEDDDPLLSCLLGCVEQANCGEIQLAYCHYEPNAFLGCATDCKAAQAPPDLSCPDGTTIQASWRCDGASDCPNGEDEDCPAGTYTCQNGVGIPAGFLCDGLDDCPDGRDEIDCLDKPTIACDDGTSVLPSQECDGTPDCAGGEDELDCTRRVCH